MSEEKRRLMPWNGRIFVDQKTTIEGLVKNFRDVAGDDRVMDEASMFRWIMDLGIETVKTFNPKALIQEVRAEIDRGGEGVKLHPPLPSKVCPF